MKPGCRRISQRGHSLLELTVTMAVAALLAVAGMVLLDSGGAELTAAQHEVRGSLEQAFTLARARGTNVTVAFGKATGTGGQVVVPFGRRVQWGKPTHIPLPPNMDKPAVATLTGTAHATVTVTPRHTAEASTWFLSDGQEALCMRLSDHGRLQVLRWRRDLSSWTRV
ncbi:MAG TPA: prepilin-type N-terminal cleavage/methylation domain-containing protein [Geothrix sp.]